MKGNRKSIIREIIIFYKNRTPIEKITIWGIVLTLIIAVLSWFGEPLAQKMVDNLFGSSTITQTMPTDDAISYEYTISSIIPSLTQTLSPTTTPSYTKSPEPTFTPSYTNTPTPLPTRTIIPGIISKNCLNRPWEGKELSYVNNCVNLTGKGISTIDNGFVIYAEAISDEELEKTVLILPITSKMKSIKFSVELTRFKESYREQPTLLFFGAADNIDSLLTGSYIVFDKTTKNNDIHSTYVKNNEPDLYAGRRGDTIYSEQEVVQIEFVINDLNIDIIKNGQFDYDYSRMSTSSIEQPVFVIGYIVGPGGGILSSEINDFIVKYEE